MAKEIAPPKPDLSNIRMHLRKRLPLWQLCGWGSAAAVALMILAITTQTESGSQRLQQAFASENLPDRTVAAADVPTRVIGIDKETVRLEAQLRVLTADRDRLTARVALLERSLDDVTGSIKRQVQEAAKASAPASTPPAPQLAAAPLSAPPPAKIAPAKTEPPMIAPLAMPAAGTERNGSWPATPSAQAATPSAEVPVPPERVAALPAPSQPMAEPPRKPEIGVDLGGAPNIEVLSLRWAAVKANFGPLLTGLYPRAAHVHRQNRATDVRLLVGPLPSVTAATQLCARFAAAHVTCRPVKFDGEQFAQR